MKIIALSFDNTDYKSSRSLEIHLVEEFARQGHEVCVFCERELHYSKDDPKPEKLTSAIAPINDSKSGDLKEFIEKHNLKILPFKPDIIFASSITGANLATELAKEFNVPCIVQVLDIPKFRWIYKHYKDEWKQYLTTLKKADHIIANTSATVKAIHEYFRGKIDDKVSLIHYGIDPLTADRVQMKPEPEWDIVCIGRLVHHKAIEKLIYALAVLKEQGIRPKPVIIGEGQQFMQLVDLCGFLSVRATFPGPIDDLEKFRIIKGSRMMVIPDICEDIGSLAPAEGIYCEIPVICSDLKINRERFGDWPTYVPAHSIEELAKAIKIHLDESNMFDFSSEEAKQWIIDNRTYQVQAKKTLEVFSTLL